MIFLIYKINFSFLLHFSLFRVVIAWARWSLENLGCAFAGKLMRKIRSLCSGLGVSYSLVQREALESQTCLHGTEEQLSDTLMTSVHCILLFLDPNKFPLISSHLKGCPQTANCSQLIFSRVRLASAPANYQMRCSYLPFDSW